MVKSMVEASTEVAPTATVGASISTWTPTRPPAPRTVPSHGVPAMSASELNTEIVVLSPSAPAPLIATWTVPAIFPIFCRQKNVSYLAPLCNVVPQFNVDVATSANAVAANAEQIGFVPVPRTVTADWAEIVNSLKATGPTMVPTFANVTQSIALSETIVITATAAMSGINRLAEIFNLCLTSHCSYRFYKVVLVSMEMITATSTRGMFCVEIIAA